MEWLKKVAANEELFGKLVWFAPIASDPKAFQGLRVLLRVLRSDTNHLGMPVEHINQLLTVLQKIHAEEDEQRKNTANKEPLKSRL